MVKNDLTWTSIWMSRHRLARGSDFADVRELTLIFDLDGKIRYRSMRIHSSNKASAFYDENRKEASFPDVWTLWKIGIKFLLASILITLIVNMIKKWINDSFLKIRSRVSATSQQEFPDVILSQFNFHLIIEAFIYFSRIAAPLNSRFETNYLSMILRLITLHSERYNNPFLYLI